MATGAATRLSRARPSRGAPPARGRFPAGRGRTGPRARPGLGRWRPGLGVGRPGGRGRGGCCSSRRASGGVSRRCRPATRARRAGLGAARPGRRRGERSSTSGARSTSSSLASFGPPAVVAECGGIVPAGRRAAGRERTTGHRSHPLAGSTGSNRLASRWSRRCVRTTRRSWCWPAPVGAGCGPPPGGRAGPPPSLVTFHVERDAGVDRVLDRLDREVSSPQRCAAVSDAPSDLVSRGRADLRTAANPAALSQAVDELGHR